MFLNRTYSADGSNSTERDYTVRAQHTTMTTMPTEKIGSDHRLHPTRASTDKAAMKTNVAEVETSVVPQPDIPNSTSKNPVNSVTDIQNLADEANCNCKVSAPCDQNGDNIMTAREISGDDVNEITTSYEGISSTIMPGPLLLRIFLLLISQI